jgi:hypothetical protein
MNEQPNPISDDQIASRAQELWELEGRPEGKAEKHWFRAEADLRNKLADLAAATPPAVVPVVMGIS